MQIETLSYFFNFFLPQLKHVTSKFPAGFPDCDFSSLLGARFLLIEKFEYFRSLLQLEDVLVNSLVDSFKETSSDYNGT